MEFRPGVHQVSRPEAPGVYLVEDEHSLAVIDAGWPGSESTVLRYIRALGRYPDELRHLLITHGHPDHTGGARRLRSETGASLLIHRGDTMRRNGGQAYVRHSGVPGGVLPGPWLVPVDRPLEDGEVLPVGGGIRVIGAPGHTRGSACFLLEREGVLFAGDLVCRRGPYLARSIPFPGSDVEQHHRSMERVAEAGFVVACLGHGGVLGSRASDGVSRAAKWYAAAPGWVRLLQRIPGPLRLGLEPGYRYR